VPQFTGKIVSALSSIHWCTKSFVRAVERAGTNSYCDRAMQITGDLFFLLLFSLLRWRAQRRILANCIDESRIIELFATAKVPACFYSSDWPSFLLRIEMANITTYGRHCRKPSR